MDVRAAVIEALDKLVTSGAIEQAIEKQLAETMASVVKSELASYSDFGKRLSEAVKQSLALHDRLDLPSYNHAILRIIERQVERGMQASIEREVAARMKELLTPAPESIKLSELVEQYIEHLNEQARGGCVCYGDGRITCLLEDSDYGFRRLTLAKEAGKRRNDGDIQIGITKEGRIYHLHFRDRDVEKEMFAGPFHGFERSIFQMRAAGTRIEIDAHPEELSLELEHADL